MAYWLILPVHKINKILIRARGVRAPLRWNLRPEKFWTRGPNRTGKVGGREAMTATMIGRSPLTNRNERAILFNMALNNGDYLHIIFVSPDDDFRRYQSLFRRMLQTMRINS
jgi:hypothetical protein